VIALDTNVLVRFLVGDEPRQAERARAVIEQSQSTGEPVYLSQIVLCELVWVLAGAYDAPKQDILDTLNRLAEDPGFVCDDPQRVRRAIDRFSRGAADFSDYLLGETSCDAGATATFTFDRELRDEPGFSLL
jgi:predicted nucleic-acid-binding protein